MEYIGTIEHDRGLEREEQIIIYGAGKVGRHSLGVLQKAGQGNQVMCFCESSKDKVGKIIDGVLVRTVEESCTMYPRGTYLVASMCVRQMVETLLQYGIEKIHIIRESPAE